MRLPGAIGALGSVGFLTEVYHVRVAIQCQLCQLLDQAGWASVPSAFGVSCDNGQLMCLLELRPLALYIRLWEMVNLHDIVRSRYCPCFG